MIQFKIPGDNMDPVKNLFSGSDINGTQYLVNNRYFVKNSVPWLPVMGEFHYSRWSPTEWEEALLKMKAGGIEIVATYTFWIHHEEMEGEWDFTGCRDLHRFLTICKETGMKVWLRIGPWAHGECRNGGFPDWLVHKKDIVLRSDDPKYLDYVRKFFGQISIQTKDMMIKDGGPIIGIQIENEFGHCGGTTNPEEGIRHMETLKKLAVSLGLIVPFYTATCWGGAHVAKKEMLPVYGGYVDAPWADHLHEMPACENFLFKKYLDDMNIGSDIHQEGLILSRSNQNEFPYLTAELGAGMQVTAARRPIPFPEDIEAQTLCMLGSGANLIGYYMYHGGYNPEGKYSTLQESKETGYFNDLPVKSYDFQTCIRESGELNESYGRLKKIHLMIHCFEEILARADAYFPVELPMSPEDMDTPRVSVRHDFVTGSGFIFINNHQRLRKMSPKKVDISITTITDGKVDISTTVFPDEIAVIHEIAVDTDECLILPYHFHMGNALLLETNASILCNIGRRYFFYTDKKPFYKFENEVADIVTLTNKQAEHAFLFGDRLYITEGSLIQKEDQICLITKNESSTILCYEAEGSVKNIEVSTKPICANVNAEIINNELVDSDNDFTEYEINVLLIDSDTIHELYLDINYHGDKAEVYKNGTLIADWFTTGTPWHLALKRFEYPSTVTLRIYPWTEQIYSDLPLEKECELISIKAIPEYLIKGINLLGMV